MKSSCLTVLLLLLTWMVTPAADASWQQMDMRVATAADFLPSGAGLIAFSAPNSNIARWIPEQNTSQGIKIFTNPVSSLLVRDSDVAWATVKNDGLYKGSANWTIWTRVLEGRNYTLVALTATHIFINDGKTLEVSGDESTFTPVSGIAASDSIEAIDYLSDSNLVAVAGSSIYISRDGGGSWQSVTVPNTLSNANTVYTDRMHGVAYVGGTFVYRSLDSGHTWALVTDALGTQDVIHGQVVGVHDCSGIVYVTGDNQRDEMLRSSDSTGNYFLDVGPANLSSITMLSDVAFDRGTTFFWLDKSGILSQSRNGIDGSMTDSLKQFVRVVPDSVITNDVCDTATIFPITVGYGQCIPIELDSLVVVKATDTFTPHFKPIEISETSVTIPCTFRARRNGTESATMRLVFHSSETGYRESKTFTVSATGIEEPAKLSLSAEELNFDTISTKGQKRLTITIENFGCDTLRVDSIVSSDNHTFAVDFIKHFPVFVKSGSSISADVIFAPTSDGEYLEALEIGTSAGHRFITLRGWGAVTATVEAHEANPQFQLFPNPATQSLVVRHNVIDQDGSIIIRDILGRQVLQQVVRASGSEEKLDIHALSIGTYTVTMIGAGMTPSVQRLDIVR